MFHSLLHIPFKNLCVGAGGALVKFPDSHGGARNFTFDFTTSPPVPTHSFFKCIWSKEWNMSTLSSTLWSQGLAPAIGWGPKVKIGQINKILWIQLGLYIRKPGEKSLTQKKLILMRGIAFEKNGPCSWENEVKISKKRKMAKNHFSRSYFGS